MKFLDLCKRVARESGTLNADSLTNVTNQAKRAERIVGWVGDAYRKIQDLEPKGWPWLQERFTGKLTIPLTNVYTGAAWFPDGRFRRFIADAERKDACYYPFSFYKQSDGVSQEAPLPQKPWGEFVVSYLRGEQTPSAPRHCAIEPGTGRLLIGPTPDDVYVINGERQKTNQVLSDKDDVPEMPGHNPAATDEHMDGHAIIVWAALMRLAEYDEGTFALASYSKNYKDCLNSLYGSADHPDVTIAWEPIA